MRWEKPWLAGAKVTPLSLLTSTPCASVPSRILLVELAEFSALAELGWAVAAGSGLGDTTGFAKRTTTSLTTQSRGVVRAQDSPPSRVTHRPSVVAAYRTRGSCGSWTMAWVRRDE